MRDLASVLRRLMRWDSDPAGSTGLSRRGHTGPVDEAALGHGQPWQLLPDFNTVPPSLRSVLIADPDAAFRRYLATPLAARGFTIYEAASFATAWELALQNRPWIILTDIALPGLDGFELCRRVRSHPVLSRLPVLFISDSDTYHTRYRALQIGADDFLPKSLPRRELLMRVQLLMTRYCDLSSRAPTSDEEQESHEDAKHFSREQIPDEEQKAHKDAKRLARLVVSEIRLYNESRVSEGRKNKDIYERLKEDIERGRQIYHDRVAAQVRDSAHYFYDELVGILAGGDAAALGPVPSTLLAS